MAEHTAIPYVEESDPAWSEDAARTATVELFPNEQEPVRIVITGPCPRCNHHTRFVEPIFVLRGVDDANLTDDTGKEIRAALDRAGVAVQKRDVEVICSCSGAHPAAPAGEFGCGRSWTLSISWGPEP